MKLFAFPLVVIVFCSCQQKVPEQDKKDEIMLTHPHKDKKPNVDSIIKNRYTIVPFSYENTADTAAPFSYIPLYSNDFLIGIRMEFLKNRFQWNFTHQLDSAFVFAMEENIDNKKGNINFEIWYNLDKDNSRKVIDSLEILFDNTIYYKPPTEWHWFIYKDKIFFMDCKIGIWRERLYDTRDRYKNDTLFLDYV